MQDSGVIYRISLTAPKIIDRLTGHDRAITALDGYESGLGSALISGDENGKIILWSLENNKQIQALDGSNLQSFSTSSQLRAVRALAFSSEGAYACSLDKHFGSIVWNLKPNCFLNFTADQKDTEQFVVNRESKLIVSANKTDHHLRSRHLNAPEVIRIGKVIKIK